MRLFPAFAGAVALLTCASAGFTQTPMPKPFAYESAYPSKTPQYLNQSRYPQLVHSEWIRVPDAPSLRVFFAEVDVALGSGLLVSSMTDGNQHFLTEQELAKWGSSTAFFNGDTLLLELYLAPGARGSYAIDHLLVGLPIPVLKSQCGPTDDRVPSTDNRTMRMLNSSGTAGCSGWLASADDCVFSAGHCFPTYAYTAEVNVPLSTSSGALVHPPTQDQFPVDQSTIIINYNGLGDDWALAHLHKNNLNQSAAALYGYFTLGFFIPNVADTIRITGFGSDTGTENQTCQTHAGPYYGTNGTIISYVVDTTGGNSGSVVIHEVTGQAVGVHTNGGCSGSGGSNSGTSVTNAGLKNAWMANCASGPPAQPVASFTSDLTVVVETQAVQFTDTSTGVPTSWAWDFDEDTLIDSTLRNPSFTYTTAGKYDVTLMVSNSVGSDSVTVKDYVTVNAIKSAVPPYQQDFTSGLPGDGHWLFQSSSSYGSIRTGDPSGTSPGSGGPALLLSSTGSGSYATNEAILLFELDQNGEALLSYYFKEFSDEDDPEDGVFLSNGSSEVLVVSHQGGPQSWTLMTADLGAAAAAAGFAPGAKLRLIFRQRDNYDIPTDGHAIDDVKILPRETLTVTPAALSAGAGGTATFSIAPGVAHAGKYYFLVGSISGTEPGFNAYGYHVSLNYDPYLILTLTYPNLQPLSKFQGFLDATGRATAYFVVPPGSGFLANRTFDQQYFAVTGSQIDYVSNVARFVVGN